MAALLHAESSRKYSWWWDSHNSPKNSKWLQENLTDMDAKVKSMIKLIEEDADSFARRAEMYYKKRPELMKLVEEFYRAYRALAERYNHATGELRHAHRTIAKAFPDQVPPELVEDSPSKPSADNWDPQTPESKFPVRALFATDDDARGPTEPNSHSERRMRKRGLKEEKENDEAEGLRKALADTQAEKEDVLLHYQECLEKLANLERELNNAQKDSKRLDEKASRAEIEVETLKEALVQLEAEKKGGMVKDKEYLEKISNLENMLSLVQYDKKGIKDEISRLKLEKEDVLNQHKETLEKILVLENVVSLMESEATLLKKQAEIAENEVSELKKTLAEMNEEKAASVLKYKCCLETISKLEKDISIAKKDVERLNKDVLIGNSKLKIAEEKYSLLEMSNLSLRTEAENLVKKITLKDQELSEKQEELENLNNCLQDEHSRRAQIEETLQTLQNLHSQSQDDRRALAEELKNVLKMLKDLEVSKSGLEEEIRQAQDENQSLSEMNLSSAFSMENMQNEILSLREIKERLEKEVSRQVDFSNSLQQEILGLKEEIKGLNKSYEALVEQVEAMKSFQDENSKLRQINMKESNEKEILSKKLESVQELLQKKEVEESCSLSYLNSELSSSQEKLKALQDSCQFLNGEKAALIAEKASLFSQIQAITENMHKLLEKNAVLENSLSTAKVELEGLREKSKGLEEICELLKNERSYLLTERGNLAFKLENVERRLETLEKRFNGLEEKCAGLEKEKEAFHFQVEKLEVSLSVEKQERMSSHLQSESRLAGLENHIHFLQEENRWNRKEFEEELEKSLKAQFEISILQKFMKEMEEKNYSLIIECQKHVEASKLAEKIISELESESLEQHVEAELLLDEIERLRLSIYQIFRALEKTGQDCHPEDKIENERTFVQHILGNIEEMKVSISKHEDDRQQLLVENSVLLTLLEQLESKGIEIESQKICLEKEFKNMAEKFTVAKNEKEKLLELNEKLRDDASESHDCAGLVKAELEHLSLKQIDLHKAYAELNESYLQLNQDNENLLKKFSDLKEEKFRVDRYCDAALVENLTTANQSEILRSFAEEKLREVKLLLEDLNRQGEVNVSLEREMSELSEQIDLQKAENLLLKDAVYKLEKEKQGMREYNVQMKKEIVNGKNCLLETEGKLLNVESKLEAAENLNSQLCRTVDELKMGLQESLQIRENLEKNILQLSENDSMQKKEIDSLHRVKTNLESEISLLRVEMEEKIIREQILSSELQEKNNDFQLWESEAASFYFDLQISSVHEVLFRNKVEELTGVCLDLQNENSSKTSEIEQMKRTICSMESEISGLKSQLHAYAPVVAALKEDIAVLEHNALLQAKLKASRNQEAEFMEDAADPSRSTSRKLPEDQSIITLQNLQTRIKAVGKMMEDTNKPVRPRRSTSKSKQESPMIEIHHSKPRGCLGRPDHSRKKGYAADNDTPKLQKIKTKASEVWNGMLMKDIPLDQISNSYVARRKKGNTGTDDQMLELWETAEDLTIGESLRLSYKMTDKDIVYDQFSNLNSNSNSNSNSRRKFDPPSTDSDVEKELGVDKISTEPKREVSVRRILERLNSDAQKLENLQITVQNLREKLETSSKKSRKSAKNVDFETVHEQLLEAEETVEHLVDLNGQLVKNMEECPSPDAKASPIRKEAVRTRRRKVTEQARKGSERIGRLQLEVQKIQYILLKMEDEKKKNGKSKFFRSKTIVLRDFIGNGRKNSVRRKKGPLCGCFRPSSSRSGRSSTSQ